MIPPPLWAWARGDLSDDAFHDWIYAQPEAQYGSFSSEELRLAIFERDPSELRRLRKQLIESLPRSCACPIFCDRQVIMMGSCELPRTLATLAARTPWLDLIRCEICGAHWHLASDTDDAIWYLERLSAAAVEDILARGIWPTTFDDFAHVWPDDGRARSEAPPAGFTDCAGIDATWCAR